MSIQAALSSRMCRALRHPRCQDRYDLTKLIAHAYRELHDRDVIAPLLSALAPHVDDLDDDTLDTIDALGVRMLGLDESTDLGSLGYADDDSGYDDGPGGVKNAYNGSSSASNSSDPYGDGWGTDDHDEAPDGARAAYSGATRASRDRDPYGDGWGQSGTHDISDSLRQIFGQNESRPVAYVDPQDDTPLYAGSYPDDVVLDMRPLYESTSSRTKAQASQDIATYQRRLEQTDDTTDAIIHTARVIEAEAPPVRIPKPVARPRPIAPAQRPASASSTQNNGFGWLWGLGAVLAGAVVLSANDSEEDEE